MEVIGWIVSQLQWAPACKATASGIYWSVSYCCYEHLSAGGWVGVVIYKHLPLSRLSSLQLYFTCVRCAEMATCSTMVVTSLLCCVVARAFSHAQFTLLLPCCAG